MKQEEKFIRLLAAKRKISLSELKKNLDCRLNEINRLYEEFKNKGYSISYLPNGYLQLEKFPSSLDPFLIKARLATEFVGKRIKIYDIIDSTNLRALQEKQFSIGEVIIAEGQTAGRGRLGRNWQSAWGKGIYLSVILKPTSWKGFLSQITLVGAIATAVCLKKSYKLEPKIRWPNDILIQGRKIAGILAEVGEGKIVLGIGINVNQSSSEIPPEAISYYLLKGEKINRNLIIAELLNYLEKIYLNWEREGLVFLKDYWYNFSYGNHDIKRIETTRGRIYASLLDLDEDGIIVRLDTGTCVCLKFNEVLEIR